MAVKNTEVAASPPEHILRYPARTPFKRGFGEAPWHLSESNARRGVSCYLWIRRLHKASSCEERRWRERVLYESKARCG